MIEPLSQYMPFFRAANARSIKPLSTWSFGTEMNPLFLGGFKSLLLNRFFAGFLESTVFAFGGIMTALPCLYDLISLMQAVYHKLLATSTRFAIWVGVYLHFADIQPQCVNNQHVACQTLTNAE